MATVRSEDMLSLYRRSAKAAYEIRRSDSAGVSNTTEKNLADFRMLTNDYRAHVEFVESRPKLNLPHAVDQDIAMPLQGELVENNDCNDILRLLEACATHLILSDSAKISSGFSAGDYQNQVDLLDKIDILLQKIEDSPKSKHPEGNAPGAIVPGNVTSN